MTFELTTKEEERALKLHHDSLVIDCHSDIHLHVIRARGQGKTHVLEKEFYERWVKAGLNVVVLNTMAKFGPEVYPYRTSPVHNFLLMVDAINQELLESPEHFFLILKPEDIEVSRNSEKIGIMLGLEGAEAIEMNLGFLRCYHRLGLRIMNLTWHLRNQVADGVAEPSNSGLSNFGREVVAELNRLGIIIDVSHLSKNGVRDVLDLSKQPVIASHSNAVAICDHQRNLEDWQIKEIAEKGGIVGVAFLGRFVADKDPTIKNVLDHVDHIKKLAGSDCLAIGPDYTDFCQDMIISSRRVAGPGQPVNDLNIPYAEGLEDVTNLSNFTRGLISRNYKTKEVRGILGENFLRLFKGIYKDIC